jgi:hypothetical protein
MASYSAGRQQANFMAAWSKIGCTAEKFRWNVVGKSLSTKFTIMGNCRIFQK